MTLRYRPITQLRLASPSLNSAAGLHPASAIPSVALPVRSSSPIMCCHTIDGWILLGQWELVREVADYVIPGRPLPEHVLVALNACASNDPAFEARYQARMTLRYVGRRPRWVVLVASTCSGCSSEATARMPPARPTSKIWLSSSTGRLRSRARGSAGS